MSSEQSTAPVPSSSSSSPAGDAIIFTVKSNNDTKFQLSLPATTTIEEVKRQLEELSQVPVDRQRLIYSGRVMKNDETLDSYKVKSGNTVHMVKGAVSNTAAAGASGSGGAASAVPAVPRNIAAGSGNNPLAGLTGARFAGHVQLPNASVFGPDGGMGPPPDPEGIAQAMSNPMFQAQMNEMLQNPQLLDYIIASNPVLQSMGPSARQLMQSDMFRRMVTDPDTIRQMASLGAGVGGAAFPAPGATNTTESSQPASTPSTQPQQPPVAPANPFASLFGGAQSAPLASLFNPPPATNPAGSLFNPPPATNPAGSPPLGDLQNPFMSPGGLQNLLAALGGPPPAAAGMNPFASMLSQQQHQAPWITVRPRSGMRSS